MRLIDAGALKEYMCSTCPNQERCRDTENVCSTIADIAEQPTVEAAPVNGWISVKDGMPKLGQRVMAFCRAGILTFLRYDGEVWFEMSSRNEYLLSFVTHWQHLPEPPKGE